MFKKILAAVCAGAIAMSLAGCKNGGETDSSDETAMTEESGVISDEIDTAMTSLEFTAGIKVGWNLGNTLAATGTKDISSEKSWGNPQTTEEMMIAVKEAGFNAVRIPTSWGNHMDENHNIAEDWMARVKQVVDYAYNNDLYVILNMHHEDWNYPYEDNKEAASDIMSSAWTQISEVFKGYDERLIFEGMNEPRWVGTNFEWNGGNEEGHTVVNHLNQVFVDTVRATGGNNAQRFLMVCPYAASSSRSALEALELPNDSANRLIVSVHAYTPYSFALQQGGSNKWLADKDSSTRDIDYLVDTVNELFTSKGTAVIIGECGAMNKDNEEYRAEWAKYYMSKFKEIGIPCFLWDNGAFYSGETFGLLDRYTNTWKYPDLMAGIMEGAGAVDG